MTKTAKKFIAGFVLVALSAVAGCAPVEKIRSPSGTTTTVILLRHAERYGPDLIEEGRARAAALPAAVARYDIAAIYSPDLVRNLDTVRPLSKQRGLEITVIDVKNVARRLVHRTVVAAHLQRLAEPGQALGKRGRIWPSSLRSVPALPP